MVRARRTLWVDGKKHVSDMVFTDVEWKLIQENKDHVGRVSFELVDGFGKPVDVEVREPDDKPSLMSYEQYRVKGEQNYQAKKYADALYFFEKAYNLKTSSWITGRMNKCRREIKKAKQQ